MDKHTHLAAPVRCAQRQAASMRRLAWGLALASLMLAVALPLAGAGSA
ncbi:hypothetical protein [Pseudoduganella violacea]|uniref:Uncharacterized protein n=1 Tax=Pseudoduganella violacea TaxID=1715466 RepID=A0A7W5FVL2_9BURK|nr:hypothetical protein [Pseudoduganella violacea]MBB3121115.1 hypothetical protein [Pseudoduganella violacea]